MTPNSCSCSRVGLAVACYVLWTAFGFFTGAHIWVLVCVGRKCDFLIGHVVIQYAAILILAIGGGICRSEGSNSCPGGYDMGRDCLRYHQAGWYQFAYITHFMGGAVPTFDPRTLTLSSPFLPLP